MNRIVKLVVAALVLVGSSLVAQLPANAINSTFTLNATMSNLSGKTVQWIAKTGRVLDSEAITTNSQAISLSSGGVVSSVSGSTLQLITTSGGDYFGPVVLGWTTNKKVHTSISFGSATTVSYGTIAKQTVAGTTVQGWAKATTNWKKSKPKATRVLTSKVVAAVAYKPKGVGTYGKSGSATAIVSPGVTEGSTRNSAQARTFGQIDLNNVENLYAGADPDGDGLPSFADINDDGDTKVDAADTTTPEPPTTNPSAPCEAQASFNVFTNFKSTSTDFNGNINVYGSGNFGINVANPTSIVSRLNDTLTMAIEKVSTVCGSNVTKWEVKGVGLPYAPADYVDITTAASGAFDFQWSIGQGSVNGHSIAGLAFAGFTSASQISGQDVLMQRVTTANGQVYEFSSTAGFVFVSHPLPIQYKVVPQGTAESAVEWTSMLNVGGTASTYGEINVANNDTVYLKIYRPQRMAVAGELAGDGSAATFMDIGGFRYTPDMPNTIGGSGSRVGKCDVETNTDSTFTDTSINTGTPPTYIISWTLSDCFSARSITWPSGYDFDVDVQVEPSGQGGNSAQKIAFHAD